MRTEISYFARRELWRGLCIEPQHGAQPELQTKQGQTASMLARENGYIDIAEYIENYNAHDFKMK